MKRRWNLSAFRLRSIPQRRRQRHRKRRIRSKQIVTLPQLISGNFSSHIAWKSHHYFPRNPELRIPSSESNNPHIGCKSKPIPTPPHPTPPPTSQKGKGKKYWKTKRRLFAADISSPYFFVCFCVFLCVSVWGRGGTGSSLRCGLKNPPVRMGTAVKERRRHSATCNPLMGTSVEKSAKISAELKPPVKASNVQIADCWITLR